MNSLSVLAPSSCYWIPVEKIQPLSWSNLFCFIHNTLQITSCVKEKAQKFKTCPKTPEWLNLGKCHIWEAAVQLIKGLQCCCHKSNGLLWRANDQQVQTSLCAALCVSNTCNKHNLSQHSIYSINYITAYTIFLNNHQVTYSVPTGYTKSF